MKITWFVVITLGVIGVGYAAFEFLRPEFPVQRTITNKDGRELVASIEGRAGDIIFVDRISDRERFEIDINSLTAKDRLFCLRLRERPAPAPEPEVVVPTEDPYIEVRKQTIKDLRERSAMYEKEIRSGSLPLALDTRRREQMGQIDMEIKELESDIETYKYRMKK
jgi:hypothetical protein